MKTLLFRLGKLAGTLSARPQLLRTIFILAGLGLSIWSIPMTIAAESKTRLSPTVVLVHGAWADGSSWNAVIAQLQAKGLKVVSVQNPLSSLTDDVDATRRAIDAEKGPVVLVGHSYGGTVITQAGNSDKVAALVYVAAFAPDEGESTNDLQKPYPVPPYVSKLEIDAKGYLWMPQEAVPTYFAQDVAPKTGKVLAATQGPIRAAAFEEKVTQAAWRRKPSWYVLTDQDRMIYPDLQRDMAKKIGATVATLHASHVPFISKPDETTAVILAAIDKARSAQIPLSDALHRMPRGKATVELVRTAAPLR